MLLDCPACSSFLPPQSASCVHCDWSQGKASRKRLRGRLARTLLQALGAASLTLTLMACYGAAYQYDPCYDEGTCACPEAGCGPHHTCVDGYCESIPCFSNADCSEGFECLESYMRCERIPPCYSDGQCDQGEVCVLQSQECVPAPPNCDASEVSCDLLAPDCPAGTLPGVVDSCYSGVCHPIDECQLSGCAAHLSEELCASDEACEVSYRGEDCTAPDGSECSSETSDCNCETFVFSECLTLEAAPEPAPM